MTEELKASHMQPSTEDMDSDYTCDCGSCGKEFSWKEFKDNDLFCPHCGWDSVRIAKT